MEPSKNAKLSHRRPQGSTTEENSLGLLAGGSSKEQFPEINGIVRVARRDGEPGAVLTCTRGTCRTWGDAELLRHSRAGMGAGGRS